MAEFDYDLFVIGAGSGACAPAGSRPAMAHALPWPRNSAWAAPALSAAACPRNCWSTPAICRGTAGCGKAWLDAGRKEFDWAALRDFVASDVDRLERAYTSTLDNNKVDHFHERATIAGPNTVRLASGREISAKYILVAVGAWPVMPEFPGNEHAITSNEVFHLESFPSAW
jgi:glutathione reductase (NADPH)